MKQIALFLVLAGLLVGIIAAWFWWKASRLSTPPLPGGPGTAGGISMLAQHNWLKEVESGLRTAGRLNSIAAVLSGVAVVLSTASGLVGFVV